MTWYIMHIAHIHVHISESRGKIVIQAVEMIGIWTEKISTPVLFPRMMMRMMNKKKKPRARLLKTPAGNTSFSTGLPFASLLK